MSGVLVLLAVMAIGFGLMWQGRNIKPSGRDGGVPPDITSGPF